LIRSQGVRALNDVQASFNELRDPTEPLAHGAMILFSGALLLTPGFFTDTIGFALLVPAVRSSVYRYIRARVRVQSFDSTPPPQPQPPRDETIIDGDFEEIDPNDPADGSGWTRH